MATNSSVIAMEVESRILHNSEIGRCSFICEPPDTPRPHPVRERSHVQIYSGAESPDIRFPKSQWEAGRSPPRPTHSPAGPSHSESLRWLVHEMCGACNR